MKSVKRLYRASKKGCNLVLIGRNKEKGEKVVEQIRKVADNHVDIDYLIADLVLMKKFLELLMKYQKNILELMFC